MNNRARTAVLFIAQGFFSGRSPIAPGTAGTVVGVLLYLAMGHLSFPAYGAACLIIFFAGVWISGKAEDILGAKDSPSIVIDEIAGLLVTLFMAPPGWAAVAAGFVLFRIFDIMKPWPVNSLQDLPRGWGVMADDLGAAVYANVMLHIAARFGIL